MSSYTNCLRIKAMIKFEDNIFTKNELKALFVKNYSSKNGSSLSSSLNNNMTYQCFRNAAFYLLSRLQGYIWDLIDTLPNTDVKKYGNFSEDERHLYLIIQTFIELMDDIIINRIGTGSNIETKRTDFLDKRLDSTTVPNRIKFSSFGILKPAYGNLSSSQRSSDFVIAKFTQMIFKQLKIHKEGDLNSLFDANLSDLEKWKIKSFTSPEKYLLIELETTWIEDKTVTGKYKDILPSAFDVFGRINELKSKNFIKDDVTYTYNLVGLLLDCPNDIGHQVTSICYGSDCTNSPPVHNFHDDNLVVPRKSLIPDNFALGVDTGLQWGCKTKGINVQYILYEKTTVPSELQEQVTLFSNSINQEEIPVIHGGSYKSKYLKYKQKYLILKLNK